MTISEDFREALADMIEASQRVREEFPAGGHAPGYPAFLPDFDEVPGALAAWHRASELGAALELKVADIADTVVTMLLGVGVRAGEDQATPEDWDALLDIVNDATVAIETRRSRSRFEIPLCAAMCLEALVAHRILPEGTDLDVEDQRQVDVINTVMLACQPAARRRLEARGVPLSPCSVHGRIEVDEAKLGAAVIALLAARTPPIRATWEFPGYLDVEVPDGHGLSYGTSNGDWSGHYTVDEDGYVPTGWEPATLPLCSPPEGIAAVLIAEHDRLLAGRAEAFRDEAKYKQPSPSFKAAADAIDAVVDELFLASGCNVEGVKRPSIGLHTTEKRAAAVLESLASFLSCVGDELPGTSTTTMATLTGLLNGIVNALGLPENTARPVTALVEELERAS